MKIGVLILICSFMNVFVLLSKENNKISISSKMFRADNRENLNKMSLSNDIFKNIS